ncbi:MAG: stage III sporulation protein AE, partial [Clostridiaceae bacterium]|nr:stage III sporulation protein AE [Clostridiaceae bacterium]
MYENNKRAESELVQLKLNIRESDEDSAPPVSGRICKGVRLNLMRCNEKIRSLQCLTIIITVIVLFQLIFTTKVFADDQYRMYERNEESNRESNREQIVQSNGERNGESNEENNGQISEDIITSQLQSPEVKALKDYFNEFASSDAGKLLEKYTADEIMSDAVIGKLNLNITHIFKKIVNYFLQEIYVNMHILLELIALIIFCAVLNNLQNSFAKDGVGEIAFFVCYIVLVSLLVVGFKKAATYGIEAINQMAGFMKASIPVIISLLISSGSITSGGVFRPILIMVVEIAALVVKNIFVPLIFLSTVLSIVNNISDRLHLDKLAGLVKKTGLVIIGIVMTIFVGILAIQGPISAVADGIANKTVKFALGTFIPIVGGYLADAADTVIGCTLLIKNAAGIVVMIGIISICIIPLLKMSVLVLMY